MKNSPKLSLKFAVSLVLVSVFLLFGITTAVFTYSAIEKHFSNIQQQDFNRRITIYGQLIEQFVETNETLLEDIAAHSIISQSVMQPDAMRSNLVDHMDRIRLIGRKVQTVLLDFEGKVIHRSQSVPVETYESKDWIQSLLQGKFDSYFGSISTTVGNYITLARAVKYNGLTEGVLIVEIPVFLIEAMLLKADDFDQERFSIYHNENSIVSIGATLPEVPENTFHIPERKLKLVGRLTNKAIVSAQDQIMLQQLLLIAGLASIALIAFYYITRKIVITPIEKLRNFANIISSDKAYLQSNDNSQVKEETEQQVFTEFSSLYQDFSRMSETIALRTKQLKNTNKYLENMVEERTSDLEDALAEAENASRAKGQFLANMSHEIRTPMNGILGMLSLLLKSELSDRQTKHATLAKDSAQSLLTIINDILDFSKIESGKLEFEEYEFNLAKDFETVARIISPLAHRKGLELILDVSLAEDNLVLGDPTRINQLLNNLLGNAIKFTSEGEITLKARVREEGGTLKVIGSVKDSGVGIPEEKISTLFESFSQADSSTTRKYGGTGLGLSISKQLCSLMGGDVWVDSQVGQGSEFHFTFKLKGCLGSSEEKTNFSGKDSPHVGLVIQNTHLAKLIKKGLQVTTPDLTEYELGAGKKGIIKNHGQFDLILVDEDFLLGHLELFNGDSIDPQFDGAQIIVMGYDFNFEERLLGLMAADQQGLEKLNSRLAILQKPFSISSLHHEIHQRLTEKDAIEASGFSKEAGAGAENSKDLNNAGHVLLVEDNPINQMVCTGLIEELGYSVTTVNNGAEAINTLIQSSAESFCLVLMDCQMPEMDGFETTSSIRSGAAGERFQDVPIIALTANSMEGDKERCLEVKMNDYLSKPIDEDALAEKLSYWMGSDHSKAEARKNR